MDGQQRIKLRVWTEEGRPTRTEYAPGTYLGNQTSAPRQPSELARQTSQPTSLATISPHHLILP